MSSVLDGQMIRSRMMKVADVERVEFTELFRDKEMATFPVFRSQTTLRSRLVPSSALHLLIIHPSCPLYLYSFLLLSTMKDGASSTTAAPGVTSRSTSL